MASKSRRFRVFRRNGGKQSLKLNTAFSWTAFVNIYYLLVYYQQTTNYQIWNCNCCVVLTTKPLFRNIALSTLNYQLWSLHRKAYCYRLQTLGRLKKMFQENWVCQQQSLSYSIIFNSGSSHLKIRIVSFDNENSIILRSNTINHRQCAKDCHHKRLTNIRSKYSYTRCSVYIIFYCYCLMTFSRRPSLIKYSPITFPIN